MAKTEKCPYCNQPLATSAAVEHLRGEEKKQKKRILAEVKAGAEKKIRAQLEQEGSKRERGLERTIAMLQKNNGDLERRLEGLNAPDRGEMNEADIAEELAKAFPDDEITREGKGGDIFQSVRYPGGRELENAGVILYECKDTQRWSNAFLSQIKNDGRTHRTPYLILVSRTLPANEEAACVREDVVIVDPTHVRHLAWIVRRAVIETHRAEVAGQDRAGKTARLYTYLRSDDFREQLTVVVRAGSQLSEMLQAERKKHEQDWSRRQSTYDELLHNSVAIEQAIQDIIESEPAVSARNGSHSGRHNGARVAAHR